MSKPKSATDVVPSRTPKKITHPLTKRVVTVPYGVDPKAYEEYLISQCKVSGVNLTPEIVEAIKFYYATTNMSFCDIDRKLGLPLNTVSYMRTKYAPFKAAMDQLDAARARVYEARAQEVVEAVVEPEEVPAAKLKADLAMKLAEVNDPSRYGKKSQVTTEHKGKPTIVVFNTGIKRPGDEAIVIPQEGQLPAPEAATHADRTPGPLNTLKDALPTESLADVMHPATDQAPEDEHEQNS